MEGTMEAPEVEPSEVTWIRLKTHTHKTKASCGGIGGDAPSALSLVFMSLVGGSLGHLGLCVIRYDTFSYGTLSRV